MITIIKKYQKNNTIIHNTIIEILQKMDLDLVEIYDNSINIYLDFNKKKIKRDLNKLIKLKLVKTVFYSKSCGIIYVDKKINDKIPSLNHEAHYYRLEI